MTTTETYLHAPDPRVYPWTCGELQNPITRADVKVEPPFEVTSGDQWASVCQKFNAYCEAAWEGPVRLDPQVIPADWLRHVHA